ncbi:MAG: hypothetical protein DKINENOH_01696 [bacterium]|nr:hypothetical protein [bacterium]
MHTRLADKIIDKITPAQQLYHRLVLVVGPPGSGKTSALSEVASRRQCRYVNLNLELSRRLLDLTERQRTLQLPQIMADIMGGTDNEITLLDNTEILFEVGLKQDPLRLLQSMARNRMVVAAWNGRVEEKFLLYAQPGHPEYRRYPARDLLIVSSENPAPEHLATLQ